MRHDQAPRKRVRLGLAAAERCGCGEVGVGVPVVATRIAAEGMHLVDGASVLDADTAEAMAEAVIRLHQDPELWQRLSAGGLEVMERHFSFAAAERAVRAALTPESSS